MDLGSLVPWRDKFRAPANREDNVYDPFTLFRREVARNLMISWALWVACTDMAAAGWSHQRSTSRIRRRRSLLRQNCPVSTRRTSR